MLPVSGDDPKERPHSRAVRDFDSARHKWCRDAWNGPRVRVTRPPPPTHRSQRGALCDLSSGATGRTPMAAEDEEEENGGQIAMREGSLSPDTWMAVAATSVRATASV